MNRRMKFRKRSLLIRTTSLGILLKLITKRSDGALDAFNSLAIKANIGERCREIEWRQVTRMRPSLSFHFFLPSFSPSPSTCVASSRTRMWCLTNHNNQRAFCAYMCAQTHACAKYSNAKSASLFSLSLTHNPIPSL